MPYEPRTYRGAVDPVGLVTFEVRWAETDLQVSATHDLSAEALGLVRALRRDLEGYIVAHPRYAESFVPVEVEPGAPPLVREMAEAAALAGVGPMAAVAGAIAEQVARGLQARSADVIVENGGDVYIASATDRRAVLAAGDSPLSGSVAIRLPAAGMPAAVCTSSGKVGHSVSLGSAHAVTVVAGSGALADAVATAAANRVHVAEDAGPAAAFACAVPGVRGAVVIAGDRMGVAGDIVLESANAPV